MDNRYLMLELLKIRADVVMAAMSSSIDELTVRYRFIDLVEDLRDLHIDLNYEEEKKSEL